MSDGIIETTIEKDLPPFPDYAEENVHVNADDEICEETGSRCVAQEVKTNALGVRLPRQRKRCQTVNHDASMTKQADKERACIHTILKKATQTGLLPQRTVEPIKGDIPDVDSYHDAMTVLVQAQESFEALPSDLRSKFGNSPEAFLEFVSARDEEGNLVNSEEMIELGLKNPPKPPGTPGS
jgi:phage internal scaffolding protein